MKNLLEAKQARTDATQRITELRAKATAGTWGEAEQSALDAAKRDFDAADAAVKRFEDFEALETRAIAWTPTATASNPVTVNVISSENRGDKPENVAKQFRLLDAVKESAYGRGLTGVNAEIDQEGKKEARAAGIDKFGTGSITLPSFMVHGEKRDMLAGTTTAGGYTVQTEVGQLIDFLYPRLTVKEMGATYLTGLTGNIDFPRNDAAAAVARTTEGATSTETSPTFDRVQLTPVRY
ncbi:MAG TPA: phage major capsid protein, partial [bacterium]|nr:phage major capsid protein [bacterium]